MSISPPSATRSSKSESSLRNPFRSVSRLGGVEFLLLHFTLFVPWGSSSDFFPLWMPAQLLQSAVLGSQLLDLNSLSISSGQSVWSVMVDLTCLDYDGNLLDSCMAAISLALPRLRFPHTALDPKTGAVVIVRPSGDPAADEQMLQKLPPVAGLKLGSRLQTNHLLVATSFGVSSSAASLPPPLHHLVALCPSLSFLTQILEGRLIADPTADEEELLDEDSRLSVVYTHNGELAAIHKNGGTKFSIQQVHECRKIARQRALEGLGQELVEASGLSKE